MSLRLHHKNIYATYLDSEENIFGPLILITTLCERLDKYGIRYGITGKEVAPTTGTVHYHVVVMCNKTVSIRNANQLLEIEGILPHLEKINNNVIKVIEYIKKDGNFNEVNKENEPKRKMESKTKAELMLHGKWKNYSQKEKYEPKILGGKKLEQYSLKTANLTSTEKEFVMWFKGETGEGKTRTAVEIAEKFYNGDYWISNDSLRWFDGYHGQKLAIIDDFRKAMLTDWSFLLRLLDGYNLIVQTKGGFTKWNPETIIITSPATPEEAFSWTNNEGETKQWDKANQLQRRLTHNDVDQIYNFPLWDEDKLKLENVFRKEFGMDLLAEENMMPEDWSIIEPEGFITPG
nr:REP [Human respiratory circular DNA virus]